MSVYRYISYRTMSLRDDVAEDLAFERNARRERGEGARAERPNIGERVRIAPDGELLRAHEVRRSDDGAFLRRSLEAAARAVGVGVGHCAGFGQRAGAQHLQAGPKGARPAAKLPVPSMGSMSQVRAAWWRAPSSGSSSLRMASAGKARRRRRTHSSLTARSAAVTGSSPSFISTASADEAGPPCQALK